MKKQTKKREKYRKGKKDNLSLFWYKRPHLIVPSAFSSEYHRQ